MVHNEEETNVSKKMKLVLVLIGAMVLLAACGGEKYEPQPINEATDVCEVCKMSIKDNQFATQIVTKEGRSLKFDDLGDMHVWMKENGTDEIGAAFVRDYNTKEWIKYEDAYYVYEASIRTPMAYGVVSFKQEADAKKFIEELGAGTLMNTDDLKNHSWERNREMMDEHGHAHGEDGHAHEAEGQMHGADEASGHANEASGHADEAAGHANAADGHANEAADHANEAAGDAHGAGADSNESNGGGGHAGAAAAPADPASGHGQDQEAGAEQPAAGGHGA
jgi:copper chaperone NosL